MSLLRKVASGLRFLFRRDHVDRDLDEELGAYLEMAAEEKIKEGMTRKQALRAVRLERGSVEISKEVVRSGGWESSIETFWRDIRFGIRTLRKSPGFTAVAVLTLALGIGANTAIFSLLDALVLRDLAVPHPEQLVRFGIHTPDESYLHLSLPMFKEFSRQQKVFSATFGSWGDAVLNVDMNGAFSEADVVAVTGNYFSELGATPEIGRLIEPEDVNRDSIAPTQVAVFDYGFWQRHYGGARDVIGKTIKIEDVPFTIIGVIRRGFKGLSAEASPEVIIPLTAKPLIMPGSGVIWVGAMGRLKPGVTPQQAQAQLETLWPGIQKAQTPVNGTPGELARYRSLRVKAESREKGGSLVRERFAKPLYVLFGIASAVLLLACVNLASLMLARAASRGHEMAVRAALGAGRTRIARQMLTECVMLSVAGTLAGRGFAYWASHAISGLILGEIYGIPAELNLAPDWRILGFTAAVAVVTGMLFGLAPAWRASGEDPNAALQHGSRGLGRGTGRLGKGLIVAQVALSLVLVAGAGLFVRTLEKLHEADPGFRTHSLLDANLAPKYNGYKNLDRVSYSYDLTERIRGLSGVESAGLMHMHPGDILEWTESVRIAGTNTEGFTADFAIMPGAFRTLGITLLNGRSFNWQDDDHEQHVAIVSKNFAERVFPSGNAIGQRLEIVSSPKWQNVEIVGILTSSAP